jgi:hypothetical protein
LRRKTTFNTLTSVFQRLLCLFFSIVQRNKQTKKKKYSSHRMASVIVQTALYIGVGLSAATALMTPYVTDTAGTLSLWEYCRLPLQNSTDLHVHSVCSTRLADVFFCDEHEWDVSMLRWLLFGVIAAAAVGAFTMPLYAVIACVAPPPAPPASMPNHPASYRKASSYADDDYASDPEECYRTQRNLRRFGAFLGLYLMPPFTGYVMTRYLQLVYSPACPSVSDGAGGAASFAEIGAVGGDAMWYAGAAFALAMCNAFVLLFAAVVRRGYLSVWLRCNRGGGSGVRGWWAASKRAWFASAAAASDSQPHFVHTASTRETTRHGVVECIPREDDSHPVGRVVGPSAVV